MKKKTVKKLGVLALASMLVLGGSAWLTSRQTANGINNIKTGTISVKFAEQANQITLNGNDAIPMTWDYVVSNLTPYHFDIKNDGDAAVAYSLKAVVDSGDLDSSKIGLLFNPQIRTNSYTDIKNGYGWYSVSRYSTLEEAQTNRDSDLTNAGLDASDPVFIVKELNYGDESAKYSVGAWKTTEKRTNGTPTFDTMEEAFNYINTNLNNSGRTRYSVRGEVDPSNAPYIIQESTFVEESEAMETITHTYVVNGESSWQSLENWASDRYQEVILKPGESYSYDMYAKVFSDVKKEDLTNKSVTFHLELSAYQIEEADYYLQPGPVFDLMGTADLSANWINGIKYGTPLIPYYGDVYEYTYMGGDANEPWEEKEYSSTGENAYLYNLANGQRYISLDSNLVGTSLDWWDNVEVTELVETVTPVKIR